MTASAAKPDPPRTSTSSSPRTRRSSIEHHPEDWLAFVLFWALAFIVFLQFFTRYILNDSLAWTEEIARYGLMWRDFIGGAMVTRRNSHIAVELLLQRDAAGPAARRAAGAGRPHHARLSSALLAYFSVTIVERMQFQRMTVFDLPMSCVYGGVALRLLPDARAPALARLAQCARRLAHGRTTHPAEPRAD